MAVFCAGFKGGFALDDAYCAGRIVAARPGAHRRRAGGELLAASFPTAPEAFDGAHVRPAGPRGDIAFCAQEDLLDTVPRFARMVGPAAEIVAEKAVALPSGSGAHSEQDELRLAARPAGAPGVPGRARLRAAASSRGAARSPVAFTNLAVLESVAASQRRPRRRFDPGRPARARARARGGRRGTSAGARCPSASTTRRSCCSSTSPAR